MSKTHILVLCDKILKHNAYNEIDSGNSYFCRTKTILEYGRLWRPRIELMQLWNVQFMSDSAYHCTMVRLKLYHGATKTVPWRV